VLGNAYFVEVKVLRQAGVYKMGISTGFMCGGGETGKKGKFEGKQTMKRKLKDKG
jgi:hypothetical protein